MKEKGQSILEFTIMFILITVLLYSFIAWWRWFVKNKADIVQTRTQFTQNRVVKIPVVRTPGPTSGTWPTSIDFFPDE